MFGIVFIRLLFQCRGYHMVDVSRHPVHGPYCLADDLSRQTDLSGRDKEHNYMQWSGSK